MSRVLAFCLLARPRLAVWAFAPWRCASKSFSSSFSLVLVGGIDTKFHPEREIAWRIRQTTCSTPFGGSAQANFRFSTGILIRFSVHTAFRVVRRLRARRMGRSTTRTEGVAAGSSLTLGETGMT